MQPGPTLPTPLPGPGASWISPADHSQTQDSGTRSYSTLPGDDARSPVTPPRDTGQYSTALPLQPLRPSASSLGPSPCVLLHSPLPGSSLFLSLQASLATPPQQPQGLALPSPMQNLHGSLALTVEVQIPYPKALKACVLQNFSDFREAVGVPTVT